MFRVAIFLLALVGWCGPAAALEHVVFRQDGKQQQISGRLVVEAQDGGVVVVGRDGVLWRIAPEDQIKRTHDDAPFQPLGSDGLARQLLAELPEGFEVHRTAHYLILHNTSRAYAQWCGALFERLYAAFGNFWNRKGFALSEPEFPLVAIVFADRAGFNRFSRPELGQAVEAMIGYYSLRTNWMTMYDLTGVEAAGKPHGRVSTAAAINQILAQPDALRTVATIVHEATHQIAFNCGMHARYSDTPLWLAEGIALYFETPDLGSAKGWAGIGKVNAPRLAQFQSGLRRRGPDPLKTLLGDDVRFRDPKQGLDAYAEAWALTYFLLHQQPKQYVAYLKLMAQKKPLIEDGPEKRMEQFEQFFGDRKALDRELVRYVIRLR